MGGWFTRDPDEQPPSGDEIVELLVVPLWRSGLVSAALADGGIRAEVIESFNLVTNSRTDARIFVSRHDLQRAQAVLAELDAL